MSDLEETHYPLILYHYCPTDAFHSIVTSRSIWLSDVSLASDFLEGKWIHEVISEMCDEYERTQDEKEYLIGQLDGLLKIGGALVLCLSEKGDLLSQWRGYADDGRGVSIGFNKEYLERLGNIRLNRSNENKDGTNSFNVRKILYDKSDQKLLLKDPFERIIKLFDDGALRKSKRFPTLLTPDDDGKIEKERKQAITQLGTSALYFMLYLYDIKNPSFSEELEWRLQSLMPRPHSDEYYSQSDVFRGVDFRPRNEKLVPYINVALEEVGISPVLQVVLGPKNITPTGYVIGFLRENGFKDVIVTRSSASYR